MKKEYLKKIKNLFGNINMTWKWVIIFAICTGVYTGLIMTIPFLKNTSFQDIGISYELWVLFAVIVVVNCKKGIEAMFKCFVFFLISQPLVYIVEVICGTLAFNMGLYYYRTIWLPMTFLTLPGGLIAYYCKKQNIIGSIILGLGNTILGLMGVTYLITTISDFPYHLLTCITCFGLIFIMSYFIQEKKINRIISLIIPLVLTILCVIFIKVSGLYIVSDVF